MKKIEATKKLLPLTTYWIYKLSSVKLYRRATRQRLKLPSLRPDTVLSKVNADTVDLQSFDRVSLADGAISYCFNGLPFLC
ncbi:hypothetical protein ACLB1R_28150 [Escherichia coli]